MPIFIGIDPGSSGALATVFADGTFDTIYDTPTLIVKRGKKTRREPDEQGMVEIVEDVRRRHADIVMACVEQVHADPKWGRTSIATLITSFAVWRGILAAFRIPRIYTIPQTWKKLMLAGMGHDKEDSVIVAKRLCPNVAAFIESVKNHDRAEALLLAHYARRVHLGTDQGPPEGQA